MSFSDQANHDIAPDSTSNPNSLGNVSRERTLQEAQDFAEAIFKTDTGFGGSLAFYPGYKSQFAWYLFQFANPTGWLRHLETLSNNKGIEVQNGKSTWDDLDNSKDSKPVLDYVSDLDGKRVTMTDSGIEFTEVSTDTPKAIDDYIFEIEDYVGGNIEGVEQVDRMAFTVFLRRVLTEATQALSSAKGSERQDGTDAIPTPSDITAGASASGAGKASIEASSSLDAQRPETQPATLSEQVGQAIGMASMCWSETEANKARIVELKHIAFKFGLRSKDQYDQVYQYVQNELNHV